MDTFFKATSAVLISSVLCIILAKKGKDISILITISVSCILAASAIHYLEPVIDFFNKLQVMGNLNSEIIGIVIKAVGIALLGEITGHICTDAGNAALAKTLQILASALILWLSLPLLTSLMDLIEKILGSV